MTAQEYDSKIQIMIDELDQQEQDYHERIQAIVDETDRKVKKINRQFILSLIAIGTCGILAMVAIAFLRAYIAVYC